MGNHKLDKIIELLEKAKSQLVTENYHDACATVQEAKKLIDEAPSDIMKEWELEHPVCSKKGEDLKVGDIALISSPREWIDGSPVLVPVEIIAVQPDSHGPQVTYADGRTDHCVGHYLVLKEKQLYKELKRMSMKIDGDRRGQGVMYMNFNAGYDYDQQQAMSHLTKGQTYTIAALDARAFNTRVLFEEVPNVWFNSVLFNDVEIN